jgi:UDPglucose--hexose-1-phosphate uridylyltransferase
MERDRSSVVLWARSSCNPGQFGQAAQGFKTDVPSNHLEKGMPIRFRSQKLEARWFSPDGSQANVRSVEVRYDPLLGTTARIAEGVTLQKADAASLERFQLPDGSCPFCSGRVAQVTPRIDPKVSKEPRILAGETVLFPNLVPYSQYAAVAIFTSRHWLSINEFTPKLIADNLAACIRYTRAVYTCDSQARYCAWNVNYLFPSGGSLPHPHAQVFLDPIPTTMMRFQLEAGERYWRENGTSFWEDLVTMERQRNERFVWDSGSTAWMTAFAPIGFNEVRAMVRGRETLLQLDESDIAAVAAGISRVLRWYCALGYNSFNASLFSGPLEGSASFRVNLAMVTRTAMLPYYRSDSMHLERLHWEAAVDRTPEQNAAELRKTSSEERAN